MRFIANSMNDAVLKAEEFFECDKKQLKVYAIKQPSKKMWGLMNIQGEYEIEPFHQKDDFSLKRQDKDGYIEIVSGEVKVIDPCETGRYASIVVDDPMIDVYINNEKVFGAAFVTHSDKIEFKTAVVEPITQIRAQLSKNNIIAVLEIIRTAGRNYFVKDVKCSNFAFIYSDYKEIQPSVPTLEQCLSELKKLNVDMKFVDRDKIIELLGRPDGCKTVVAEGKRPINGTSSKIKYLFKNTSYRNPDFDTEKRVNLMDHTIIPTVKVGDVLAVIIAPAVPGRDGVTVTGEVLKAIDGRDIWLKAGSGAALLDEGTKVVAASNGRAIFKNNIISVIPTLTINHDVDVSTGNVNFEGDIIIKGSVSENLKVTAYGDITVFGNVYHANIHAEGNVRIHGNIINSKVSAGLNMVKYFCILPKIRQIFSIVKAAQNAVEKGKSAISLANRREKMLQIVIENKSTLGNLFSEIKDLIVLLNDIETEELIKTLEDVKTTMTGINAQCIENVEQIKMLYDEIINYINSIEESYGNHADVIFEYGQNSFVQANGDIVITEKGCYQTNLMAKDAILFKKPSSVVRGGSLIARKCIKMGIVGTPSGISTYCKVMEEDGKIDAVYYYNNTVLNFNGKIKAYNAITLQNNSIDDPTSSKLARNH